MRLRWTPAAADDLESIWAYLRLHLPAFSGSTIQAIQSALQGLLLNPNRGRIGREEGTRELVLPRLPYIVVYRVKNADIEVLHIYHGAQHRP